MVTFLTVLHICVVLLLITVVLLQSGKGADISASFGGSSQTVFGSSGGANFFTKLTFALAGIFMTTSVALTLLKNDAHKSVFDNTPAGPVSATPAAPTTPSADPVAPAAATPPATPTAPSANH